MELSKMNGRARTAIAVACTSAFGLSAAALAAQPMGGATYTAKTNARFVKSRDNIEKFTVSKSGKTIPKFAFDVPLSCTDGQKYDMYFDDVYFTSSGDNATMQVNRKGRFRLNRLERGALGAEGAGTFDISVAGSFSAKGAFTRVTMSFTAEGPGAPPGSGSSTKCSGRISFTARAKAKHKAQSRDPDHDGDVDR